MVGGGRLTLRSTQETLDAADAARFPGAAPGPYVVIEVSDTGVGMSEEVQQKMFEPFFTTKPEGTGTGLGLSTVYGIVRQAKGWIDVNSQMARGATFRIGLPMLTQPMRAPTPAARPAQLEGSETILVVEDQDEVRRLAVTLLGRYGYRTLEARSGDEALAIVKTYDGDIHLMLTDVIMPGMTGHQSAELLKGIRPDMKVLFMSGYTADVISRQGLPTDYIEKPFTAQALAKKVRSLLANTAADGQNA